MAGIPLPATHYPRSRIMHARRQAFIAEVVRMLPPIPERPAPDARVDDHGVGTPGEIAHIVACQARALLQDTGDSWAGGFVTIDSFKQVATRLALDTAIFDEEMAGGLY